MKSEIIICDSSPIISLASLDKLLLLEKMFTDILIPSAVWEEVVNESFAEVPILRNFFSNRVKQVNDLVFTSQRIDRGEIEAINLYLELKADYLLIDDRDGREIAEGKGIKCLGTLAILIAGKKKGYVKELRPLFLKLINDKRYISKKLLNQILKDQNESFL